MAAAPRRALAPEPRESRIWARSSARSARPTSFFRCVRRTAHSRSPVRSQASDSAESTSTPTRSRRRARADEVAALFAGGNLHAVPLQAPPGAASALKACYAGWTKGATALLAAIRTLAEVEGVDAALLAEWKLSQPELQKRSEAVTVQARKAWRWIGEMEEIAASFEAAGLSGGFHRAAADIYRKLEAFKDGDAPPALRAVIAAIRRGARRKAPSGESRRRSAKREPQIKARFRFGTAAVKREAAKRLRSAKRA